MVTLTNNTFTDNPTGARFESGVIDLSDVNNPNHFINTAGLVSTGTPAVGMQFDEIGAPGSLTLFENTIGATTFEGFLPEGSFYVRIEDGTLLDTVTNEPIVINGVNATFDGINPASSGGLLSEGDLQFIEDRLYDADDNGFDNGRGQIFVGALDAATIENLEDIFEEFGGLIQDPSGLSIRFVNNNAALFAGLAPNAGDEEEGTAPQDIEPAAGDEDQQPQDIEPGAGDDENVSCWGDAVDASAAGGNVTYSFGGSFEESLSGAANCNSGVF